jgi:hypothetical protein
MRRKHLLERVSLVSLLRRVERRDERAGARGAVTSTIPSGRGAGGWGIAFSSGESNASCSNCDIVITCHEMLEGLIGFESDAD